WFSAHAFTRTSTWSLRGLMSGTSSYFSTSGPPNSWKRTAFIRDSPQGQGEQARIHFVLSPALAKGWSAHCRRSEKTTSFLFTHPSTFCQPTPHQGVLLKTKTRPQFERTVERLLNLFIAPILTVNHVQFFQPL